MKQRKHNGQFGADAILPEKMPVGRGPGKRFKAGHPKMPGSGRPKGAPNKAAAEAALLASEIPLPADGRPRDPLLCLEWVMLHHQASLQVIGWAADKLASYKYAKKTENKHSGTINIQDSEARLREGRRRAAAARAAELAKKKPA
jgi:hypothetical protein